MKSKPSSTRKRRSKRRSRVTTKPHRKSRRLSVPQRQQAEKKYAALQSDLNSMKTKLANSKTQNKALEQKVADLERKTSMLKQDAFTPEAEKAKRLQSLQAQKDDLEREIDLALQ